MAQGAVRLILLSYSRALRGGPRKGEEAAWRGRFGNSPLLCPYRSPDLEQRPWHSGENLLSQLLHSLQRFPTSDRGPLILFLLEFLIEEMPLWWLLAWQSLLVLLRYSWFAVLFCLLLYGAHSSQWECFPRIFALGWMTLQKKSWVVSSALPCTQKSPELIPVPFLHSFLVLFVFYPSFHPHFFICIFWNTREWNLRTG